MMGTEVTTNLTIVVPTCNRYRFLARLLRYYRACGAPVRMHILDSSPNAAPDSAVARLIDTPAITYTTYDTKMGPLPKLHEGLKRVTTPYAVLWADDDLMVPRSLMAAAQFLEQHRDFSVAHGVGGLFTAEPSQHGMVTLDIGPFIQRSLLDDTGAARLVGYRTKGCSVFYSVQRTRNLQRNLEQCARHGFGYFWGETALAWLSIIQGKAHTLDRLYIMRQLHDGRGDGWNAEGRRHDPFDWVTGTGFPERCDAFLRCVASALVEQDGIGFSRAHDLAKEMLWFALARALTEDWRRRYGKPSKRLLVRMREAARRIPGVRTAWCAARDVMPGRNGAISLAALRRRSSPYHPDFAPIYQAIMEENGQG
jgi:glycosyltransferase domain-containing protein